VERDGRFDHLLTGNELPRRLSAKNRYNIRTMGYYLFVRWLHVFLLTSLGVAAMEVPGVFAQLAIAAFFALSLVVSTVYVVLVERVMTAFRALSPSFCSIYDARFWWHERLWKVPEMVYVQTFNGTPFKGLMWRLMGARVGRRLFDDGCYFTERTLVTVGNDCTLNAGSKIQCHSQEDGTFKSDRSTIGAGCTLGVGALVHYGVTMGEGSVLAPDSFLMKGEEIPQLARWGGNPARELRENHIHACRTGQPNHSDPRDRPTGQQGQPADLPGQQGQPRLHRGQRRVAAWRRRAEGNIRWK
jgi:non-ribosomal peptide synthetase-like protein